MRKSFLVAGVAAFTLGVTGVAQAQTPAPSITVATSVSPSKAGTKSKPKSEKLKLAVKNDALSKATASKITVKFPSTLKLSTSGLDQCKASDDEHHRRRQEGLQEVDCRHRHRFRAGQPVRHDAGADQL